MCFGFIFKVKRKGACFLCLSMFKFSYNLKSLSSSFRWNFKSNYKIHLKYLITFFFVPHSLFQQEKHSSVLILVVAVSLTFIMHLTINKFNFCKTSFLSLPWKLAKHEDLYFIGNAEYLFSRFLPEIIDLKSTV